MYTVSGCAVFRTSLIFTANRIPLQREDYQYTPNCCLHKAMRKPMVEILFFTFCWRRAQGVGEVWDGGGVRKLKWREASLIFPLFHRKCFLTCWVTAILFESYSSYSVILSAFPEYVSFHFNTVAFVSEMNSSLLGCCVLGHLPNIIIKCECNGFLIFFCIRSIEWLFQHRVLYQFITMSDASLLFEIWKYSFF